MKFLEESSPLGANHPAVKQYNKCMRGAGDTVRSIIISANSRLAFLENNKEVAYISNNKMHITQVEISTNLKIGDEKKGFFTWQQGANGNLSLKWSRA